MKNIIEKTASILFFLCALASILAVGLICFFLFAGGIPAFFKIGFFDFLFGQSWKPNDIPPQFGILPMIVSSLYITAGAIIVGVPIGIFTAVFMAKYCGKGFHKILKPVIDLLAGIPSIVYGFFGISVIVPIVGIIKDGNGSSILSASVLLGIMILPTIIVISESSIRAVPETYYEGARALGANHTRSVFFACIPAARSGILASVILGIGRAIGETMAVVMVAGNQPRIPNSIMKGARTLTANIVLEMGYAADLHREALIATGVVLFVFILLINLSFSAIKRR